MITITETIKPFETYDIILGYHPEKVLFFDIETTGLSAASSIVFLIGVIRFDENAWQLTQWLAEAPQDEPRLLQAFLPMAENARTLIHFNGQTFDLPYIKERASFYGFSYSLDTTESLDLYQKFRPLKKMLGLDRMNQISLESYLGWHRNDRLTGKHMISLFKKYTASGEIGLRDLLILHNHDDMTGMTQLLRYSAFLMLFAGKISAAHAEAPSIPSDIPEGTKIPWQISFTLEAPLPFDLTLEQPYHLSVHEEKGILTIPLYFGELLYFFPDYKNYYYLPLENQAIHKSVAAYVDKEYRIPARPDSCYTRRTGLFLPQPKELFSPAFRDSFRSKDLYFSWSDEICEKEEMLRNYLCTLLAAFT